MSRMPVLLLPGPTLWYLSSVCIGGNDLTLRSCFTLALSHPLQGKDSLKRGLQAPENPGRKNCSPGLAPIVEKPPETGPLSNLAEETQLSSSGPFPLSYQGHLWLICVYI